MVAFGGERRGERRVHDERLTRRAAQHGISHRWPISFFRTICLNMDLFWEQSALVDAVTCDPKHNPCETAA